MLHSKGTLPRLLKRRQSPSLLLPLIGLRGYPATQHLISHGVTTAHPEDAAAKKPSFDTPFYFETGFAIFAKRSSRPFPPPFLSLPSGSFSDPLTTHTRSRDRRPSVDGQYIKGATNGDDAVIVNGQNFLGVNDGVGAWATKERGHAALWSRLIAHFWAIEAEKAMVEASSGAEALHPVDYLQSAFEQTKLVTTKPNEIYGTTTACSALLHYRSETEPFIYATNLGDCAVLVIRPKDQEIIYKSKEQWHWFDCPRQLGTNSPDTPKDNAVVDIVDIQEGDVVLAVSDGVSDNLWENEVCQNVCDSVQKWKEGADGTVDGMAFVASELMNAARAIAQDPSAESPFMERAVEEGLPMEGGKMDDISVVVGMCVRRKG
jgi:serine/threonine protein phosphatase PrpC